VAARLRPEITEVMETEKRIFSKIVKNDWGRGGAWSFYWGAFYPKGGKRIRDAQLFVVLHRDRLDFGFYIGEYGAQQRIRFMNECQSVGKRVATLLEANLAKLGISYGDLPDEKDDELELSIPSLSLGDWIDRVDQAGIRAAKELDKDQVLAISSESLVDRIVETFEALFPFVLIATQEEPLPHIQRYLAQESIEEQENPVYTVEEFAEETHMEPVAIQKWIRALKRKKQVIFYGPPGTGKTYVAQRLGKHLIGGGDGFYEVLQFHPSYAYEDFIQGLRPKAVKGGGLEYSMLPGRFKEFCESARTCTGPCALIIDEINRANLARVFGELMYLLEYRDGWVPLAGGERFQIPSNAYIVGTMNTADRSIALVDHALRRRFAFIGLYPDYDVLRRYHENTGFAPDGLVTVLERQTAANSDRPYAVGISFFLDPEIDAKVADIWEMEIEPYIEELFFDQVDKAASFSWSKVKSDILGA
jgi:5-methylcytosine-specific restriction protein B